MFSFERSSSKEYGGESKKDTPVPMPNTEVKLLNAESSWWATACEERKLPCSIWRISSAGRASALQAGGHRFEPCILHIFLFKKSGKCFLRLFVYGNRGK